MPASATVRTRCVGPSASWIWAAPITPQALDTLSAAYAEAGRFREATTVAQRAVDAADRRGERELARAIRQRMALYQAGRKFRFEGRWSSH